MDWINIYFEWAFWIEAAALGLMVLIIIIWGLVTLIKLKSKRRKDK